MAIRDKVKALMRAIPSDVLLVAAVKGRTVEGVKEAIEGGITTIGENYLRKQKKSYLLLENQRDGIS